MRIIITGVTGFIGFNLSKKLLKQKHKILGIDIKTNRLSILKEFSNFDSSRIDILDKEKLIYSFKKFKPHTIIHLAALTGVRNSLINKTSYRKINILGTQNVYLAAVQAKAQKFIFSSSSSVYGDNLQIPFSEDTTLQPKSPYAQSKVEAENILAILYHKYKIPTLILRFFSVYGPYGRTDMAPYLFTHAALSKKPVIKFGKGLSARDYTYIDDITRAISKSLLSKINWDIINIGNSKPIKLNDLIFLIEKITGKKIKIIQNPTNPYESNITCADISKAKEILSWHPVTPFKKGMKKYVNWYLKNNL